MKWIQQNAGMLTLAIVALLLIANWKTVTASLKGTVGTAANTGGSNTSSAATV